MFNNILIISKFGVLTKNLINAITVNWTNKRAFNVIKCALISQLVCIISFIYCYIS